MSYTSTSKIRKNAKELRKNLTPAEEKLWVHLRGHRNLSRCFSGWAMSILESSTPSATISSISALQARS
ncbi:DUF559 domain-containing protein [Candidatus Villigracilis vicinus]|uniref:DUF559 domain-containing protein n=1 Tax=Candidatus Villigracilis vicinus TaxID=3140679 RepID=UPI0031E5126D